MKHPRPRTGAVVVILLVGHPTIVATLLSGLVRDLRAMSLFIRCLHPLLVVHPHGNNMLTPILLPLLLLCPRQDMHKMTIKNLPRVQRIQNMEMNSDEESLMIAANAQKCKFYIRFSQKLKQNSNSLVIPAIIESIKTYALIDTGSTCYLVTPAFFKS